MLGVWAMERGRDAAGFAAIGAAEAEAVQALPSRATASPVLTVGAVTVVKATESFSRMWVPAEHLPVADGAQILIGHTRWATQGDKGDLRNASPLLAGNLVGTHNGDLDKRSVPGAAFLPPECGSTDTETLYLALNRDRADRRKMTKVLSQVMGRAALAWVDRGRQDRLYLARAALSPLAIAYDTEGNLYWASNPNWFRQITADFGGAVEFRDLTLVREGTLFTVNVAGAPVIEDVRDFTPMCRARDARLSDVVIWRGFDAADIDVDKAQMRHDVAAAEPLTGGTWTKSSTGKGSRAVSWSTYPSGSGSALTGHGSSSGRGVAAALAEEEPELLFDEDDWADAFGDDTARINSESDDALIEWAEKGMSPTVVEEAREALSPSDEARMVDKYGFSSVEVFRVFRANLIEWFDDLEWRDQLD